MYRARARALDLESARKLRKRLRLSGGERGEQRVKKLAQLGRNAHEGGLRARLGALSPASPPARPPARTTRTANNNNNNNKQAHATGEIAAPVVSETSLPWTQVVDTLRRRKRSRFALH